jgi:hemoglobin
MTTAYEAIGGEAAVRAVIRALYDRLFVDPMVGFFFAGRDKEHLIAAQTAFTCAFLGGPERYTGRALPEVHAALPILPGHFDRRRRLLEQALAEREVPEAVRQVWLAMDAGLRRSILAAGEEARALTRSVR